MKIYPYFVSLTLNLLCFLLSFSIQPVKTSNYRIIGNMWPNFNVRFPLLGEILDEQFCLEKGQ